MPFLRSRRILTPMPPADQTQPDSTQAIPRRRLGSVTRKLVFTLVLIPIVPAVSGIATVLIEEFWSPGPWSGDETRHYHFIFAALWVSALLLIWRSLVLWTMGRKWLTAMVAVVPFVQVIHGMHWWGDAGCWRGDVLRFGQHNLGIGVGTWLLVWVWWGWEKRRMVEDTISKRQLARRMSPAAIRMVATIGMIPFVVGVFALVATAIGDLGSSPGTGWSEASALGITAIVAVSIWLLIWRGAVEWSSRVCIRAVLGAVVLIGIPIAAIPVFESILSGGWLEIAIYRFPVIGWGIWMAWTVRGWSVREGPVDAGSAPRCLSCGYLLIGLRSTRCPECGDEPTIDELWRAAAGHDL